MQGLLQDLRFGLRVLARSPATSLVAVLALALGIGANTAIFSLVEAVLLKPLPYGDADRLVQVWEDASFIGFGHNTPAPANFYSWKEQNQVFSDMAASRNRAVTLSGDGDPEAVEGRAVTGNLFAVLGARPLLGRAFGDADDRPDAPPVAILSYRLWQRRYGGDPGVVGRSIAVDGRAHTVVGVMPRAFAYTLRDHDIWVPIAFTPEQAAARQSHYLQVVARLRPGVTLARARADMAQIAARLARAYPESNERVGATVIPLRDEIVGDLRPALLVLLAAVGCVLLIACANIANILLSRAVARRREIAVRLALGARRGRVVRQLLTESVLLAVAGGALGLALAAWSFDFLGRLVPRGSGGAALALDGRVLVFTAAVAVVTGVVFGLAPALSVSRQDLAAQLKSGGRAGADLSTGRLRGALVVAEVALAFTLLTAAGLILQAFVRVRGLDPGFRPEHVLTARTLLPSPRYDDPARRLAFYDGVLERVRLLPGVVSAGYTTWLPLTNRGGTSGFTIEGRPPPAPGEVTDANFREVTPDYLGTMGIALRAGRLIDARDVAGAPPVVVVNEAFTRQFFPGDEALGRRIRRGDGAPWTTIVGVVADVRQMGLERGARSEMYVPVAQLADDIYPPRDLAVRVAGDPMALAEPLRKAVWQVDPQQPVAHVRPMTALLDEEVASRGVQASLLGAFALLALVLAALGLYGVLSYAVAQRRREIGIRMALGAPARAVVRMVVGHGLRLVAIGLALGVALALAATRALAALLYGVSATDPATYAGVAAALAVVAAAASWLPARQAARLDPSITLQAE
jgi:putative ABC transport system permease protein